MGAVEDIHEANTKAFIDENPIPVIIKKRERIASPDGGWRWSAPTDLRPQTFRLIASGRVGARVERTTEDGRVVVPEFTLVGVKAAEVERGYLTILEGGLYEIAWVSRTPGWATRAEVVEYV